MPKYSITEMLLNEESPFDSLTEQQEKQFIKNCIDHSSEFKQCIDTLLHEYNYIIIKTPLIENENELVEMTKKLHDQLAAYTNLFNSSIQLMRVKAIESDQLMQEFNNQHTGQPGNSRIKSLYSGIIPQISLIQKKISCNLAEIDRQTNSMLLSVNNMGIISLQRRLVFCTNVLLEMPCTKENDALYTHQYSGMALSLSQFWHDEGSNMEPDSSLKGDKKSYSNNYLLLSLLLSFLSGVSDHELISKSCYTQILGFLIPAKSSKMNETRLFTLEQCAKESPEEFIRLYEYLFNEKHLFSNCISALEHHKQIYACFNHASFLLNASIAYDICAKLTTDKEKSAMHTTNANACKAQAIKKLIINSVGGFSKADELLIQIFGDNIGEYIDGYIDTYLEYESNHVPREDHVKDRSTKKIYTQIKKYTSSDFNKLSNNLYQLFHYWIINSTDADIKQFASDWIEYFAKNKDDLAYAYLENLAELYYDYAVILARVSIGLYDRTQIENALKLLAKHNNKESASYKYYCFLLQNELDKKGDFALLLASAEEGYEEAVNYLSALCQSSDLNLRIDTYRKIISALRTDSIFSLNLLKQCYLDGFLLATDFNTEDQIIDGLVRYFYPHLLSSLNDDYLCIEFLTQLTINIKSWGKTAYQYLGNEAKTHLPTALYLFEFWLTTGRQVYSNWEDNLENLKGFLKKHYKEEYLAEHTYFLYFKYGVQTQEYFDLLLSACRAGSKQAIVQVASIIDHVADPAMSPIYSSEHVSQYIVPTCVDLLCELAPNLDEKYCVASGSLCIYFTKLNEHDKANKYFNMCRNYIGGIESLCQSLQSEGLLEVFLAKCGASIYETIPTQYKPETPVSRQARNVPLQSRILFWENLSLASTDAIKKDNDRKSPSP